MNCSVHFYLLNDHFSIEHAEAHFNGEESELNRKYQWEDELEIKVGVSDIQTKENGSYSLQGDLPDGTSFDHTVSNMRLFEILNNGVCVAQMAVSESILSHHEIKKGDTDIMLKVFIKDNEPLANPIPGIYIAAQEFPKELIF
ncbi:hypothetical protein OAU25_02900 [Crocinitomicaceae bacterium]|nr:hypothetical protein [Crocinitomicaceae bacterium]